MKIYHCEQGSPEWAELRHGRPTASDFHRIVTPGGKLSAQSRQYAILLVTERLLNRSLVSLDTLEWVARGKELEPEAARLYEFQTDSSTTPVGFVTTDDGRIGASPDRLVGEAGLLEIKCPAPQTHVGYLLDGFDKDYRPQVQGQLLVSEREWADWMSYSPEMPPVLIRTPRDEPYIRLLAEALDAFCDMKDGLLDRARREGLFAERRRFVTEIDEHARRGAALPDEQLQRAAVRLYAPSMDRDYLP